MIDTAAPPRRRIRVWAMTIVALWLGILAVAGPLSGKLAGVVENNQAGYLPSSAESTRVLGLAAGFTAPDVFPTVVVYERATGITAEDRRQVDSDVARMAAVDGLLGAPSPVVPSQDGKALQVVLPADGSNIDELPKTIAELRAIVNPADGLTGYVAGIGGLSADQFEVFSSIDGPLLYATAGVVVLILLVVYRSPIVWLLPLVSAGAAFAAATAVVYLLAKADAITIDAQSQGILTVLVFGAGTDYALLIVARYREELHEFERPWDAMRAALRGAVPAIVASAATVVLGLLCLLASDLKTNQGTGPVAAVGIAAAVLAMTTLLPALLLLCGRSLFWPRIPQADHLGLTEHGVWGKVSELVGRRPRRVSILTGGLLVVLAFGATQLNASGIAQEEFFTGNPESVQGQEVIEAHFDAGTGLPVLVVIGADRALEVQRVVDADADVRSSAFVPADPRVPEGGPKVVDGRVLLEAVLAVAGDGKDAQAVVKRLREEVRQVPEAQVLVGGFTAINLDVQSASQRDNRVIIPLVLLVIFVVLALLLRAVVAPLLLIGTVVLSYAATLGVCALVFNEVFDFAGADSSFPLFSFVFLVALGIDYNIFLMTRVREETIETGSTRLGTLKGLAVTGGVITSAGVVLAATFSVLGLLPLVPLAQVGFAVAFGVLLDTIVVRSLLVPALVLQLGDRTWWPSALGQSRRVSTADSPETSTR